MKFSILLFIVCLYVVGEANAFGKKFYVQLGSCYLQKCVADKVDKAQAYGWPLTIHRQSNSNDAYQVISSLAYYEVDADIYITALREDPRFLKSANVQGGDFGYFISLGIFESAADAYKMKELAESILVEDTIKFGLKKREKKAEASKVLVGPYYNQKTAIKMKRKIRKTPEFPNAFVIERE